MSIRDKTFVLVDVETSGLEPKEERIVELAAQKVTGEGVPQSDPFSELVLPEPGFVIPVNASAVSGITTDMIWQHGTATKRVMEEFALYCTGADAIVAHNARFDQSFIAAEWERSFGDAFRIGSFLCTMRLAHHLLFPPDENERTRHNFKLQTLVHVFDKFAELDGDHMPHRADSDVESLRLVWTELVNRYLDGEGEDTIAALANYLNRPIPHMYMNFGKHMGEKISDIPIGYLQWVERMGAGKDRNDDIHTALMEELKKRQGGTRVRVVE